MATVRIPSEDCCMRSAALCRNASPAHGYCTGAPRHAGPHRTCSSRNCPGVDWCEPHATWRGLEEYARDLGDLARALRRRRRT